VIEQARAGRKHALRWKISEDLSEKETVEGGGEDAQGSKLSEWKAALR
jgi:hypothetical protein